MPGLKVGIGDAGDSRKAKPGGPAVWFPSTESFVRLLTADNRTMLHLIAARAPESLDELVELTGRAKPNLSRTLHRLASYGIVRIERRGRKIVPTLLCARIELILPLTRHGLPGATGKGDRA
ncbi:MAG: transcriptional regulator [Pseudomonadota bacterium]|nr:transcriptional regulator [Pseudomonadota bacterium]